MRLVTKVEDLPMTSVAEFREAAWQVHSYHRPGPVSMGIYLTWAALGGAIALLAFGLAGLAVTQESWWFVLAGVVALLLVAWRIRRVFRRAADTRAQIVALSREVDARAARGEIPMTPPGWDRPVREPLGT